MVLAERVAGSVIGNILVQLGIMSIDQLDQVLARQKEIALTQIGQTLSEEQRAVLSRICEDRQNCTLDEMIAATNAMLEQAGKDPIGPDAVKGPTLGKVIREEFGYLVDPYEVELGSAVQAVDRTLLLAESIHKDGIDHAKLDAAKLLMNDGPVISLEQMDPQPWINDAPELTRETQAVASMVKMFTNVLEHMEVRGDNTFVQTDIAQDAIRGAKALAYVQKRDVASAFRELGKYDTADLLMEELKNVRVKDIGVERKGLIAKVTRGIVGAMDNVGYRKDGEARKWLVGIGGVARTISRGLEGRGYEVTQEAAVVDVLQGVQHGVHQLSNGAMKSNSIDAEKVYDWVLRKAVQGGLGPKQMREIAAFAPEDTRISDSPLIEQAGVATPERMEKLNR